MELTPLSYVLLCLRGVVIFLLLQWVVLGHLVLALSLVLRFGGAFPLLLIKRSKVSLLLFKFMLNLGNISVCCTKQGDVEELHFLLNVFVQIIMVLEHKIFLRIVYTDLFAQGMEQIRQLLHILIPLLS